ncbi:MAG: tetratricopeptide repeat protein, partial [Elusimicrobiota bacterium]|nr:tetratricopeptide repeat protein [Elusimicrobiota bacterium]
ERFEEAAAALAAAPVSEAADAAWPEVFSALLCRGRYREAFGLGDAMLERSARTPLANSFLWPWWHRVSSRGSDKKMKFCARELARLEDSGAARDFPAWSAYCRGVLLLGLGRDAQALAEHARILRLRAPRYALMHHPFVMHLLLAGRFERTIALCRTLLAGAPDYWWFRCRMAEAIMARGDVPGGLREFARAAAAASGERARRAVTTWHGAALLWAGRYRAALRTLDEGAAIGTKIWVNCWRGAARLKLGDSRGALTDLDAAIEADPEDLEAYQWRGEAHRLAGRHARALLDLDRALALDPKYAWAYVNRALARGALGDEKGFAADYARVPPDLLAAARGPKGKRALLEAALSRAKGVRRPERYLDALWMRRPRG